MFYEGRRWEDFSREKFGGVGTKFCSEFLFFGVGGYENSSPTFGGIQHFLKLFLRFSEVSGERGPLKH